MFLLLALPHLFVFFVVFLLTFVALRYWNGAEKSKRRRYPPSLPSLPLVGSLPFLTDIAHLPEFFMKNSLELGPMFTFKIGSKLALVLNNREVINEAFLKQSMTFSGRETFYVDAHILNKSCKGVLARQFNADYRKYHHLNMSVLKKFGFGSQRLAESRILLEVANLVDELKRKNGLAFNPKALTLSVVSNVICSILFGRRQDLGKGLTEVARLSVSVAEHLDQTIDVAPVLRFVPKKWTNLQRLRKIYAEYIDVLKEEMKKCLMDGANDSFVKSFIEMEGPEYDEENLIITVFPNLHAVHMDPNVFVEPDKFRPERFLDEENNVNKHLIIPFSIGRRSCLGESLARQELFLTISCLVQRFTIRPPDGAETIKNGCCRLKLTVRTPEPFEVRMIPRED